VKTLDDLDRLHSLFEEQDPPYEVRWIKNKSAEGDVGELFYPGVHVQVVVDGAATADGEPIECEIQLRTKAQDL
jgi:ppGpp synthetase/RelA/SpoT-type nucleotidyltranferase